MHTRTTFRKRLVIKPYNIVTNRRYQVSSTTVYYFFNVRIRYKINNRQYTTLGLHRDEWSETSARNTQYMVYGISRHVGICICIIFSVPSISSCTVSQYSIQWILVHGVIVNLNSCVYVILLFILNIFRSTWWIFQFINDFCEE